ncbi:hypothetical protein HDU76_011068 [Blyttiomyces sp. JEL0837]|nr:hypothetical protein HDU76_011068 [Blyttiomyces sp. JEL0837]
MFGGDPASWSKETVIRWLQTTSLSAAMVEKVTQVFKENEVDGEVLVTVVNMSIMKDDLNIASFGLRCKVFKLWEAIEALKKVQSQCYQNFANVKKNTVELKMNGLVYAPSAQHPHQTFQRPPEIKSTPSTQQQVREFELTDFKCMFAGSTADDGSDEILCFHRTNRPAWRQSHGTASHIVQRKIRRLLNRRWLLFDGEYTSSTPTAKCLGIYIMPHSLKARNDKTPVRVFVERNGEVRDFIDNSGRYLPVEYKQSVPRDNKDALNTNEDLSDDEILPIYGESDFKDESSKNEWARKLIADYIVAEESAWNDQKLPKMARKANSIKRESGKLEEFESALSYLLDRRMPRLIDAIIDANSASATSLRRACKSLQPTIQEKMKLQFQISVIKGEFTGEIIAADTSAQPSTGRLRGSADSRQTLDSTKGLDVSGSDDESEDWSDFIVADDELQDENLPKSSRLVGKIGRSGLKSQSKMSMSEEAPQSTIVDFDNINGSDAQENNVNGSRVISSTMPVKVPMASLPGLNPNTALPGLPVVVANATSISQSQTLPPATDANMQYFDGRVDSLFLSATYQSPKSFVEEFRQKASHLSSRKAGSDGESVRLTPYERQLFMEYCAFACKANAGDEDKDPQISWLNISDFKRLNTFMWPLADQFIQWRKKEIEGIAPANLQRDNESPSRYIDDEGFERWSGGSGSKSLLQSKAPGVEKPQENNTEHRRTPTKRKMQSRKTCPRETSLRSQVEAALEDKSMETVLITDSESNEDIENVDLSSESYEPTEDEPMPPLSPVTNLQTSPMAESDSLTAGKNVGVQRKPGRRQIKDIMPESSYVRQQREAQMRLENEIAARTIIDDGLIGDRVKINPGHASTEEPIYIDQFLKEKLKPHQVSPFDFSFERLYNANGGDPKYTGAILAHAMGLEKKTFLYTLRREMKRENPVIPDHLKKGGILIVVPAAVMDNWVREINLWIPKHSQWEIFGGIYCMKDVPIDERKDVIEAWHVNNGVLVISYALLRTLVRESPLSPSSDPFYEECLLSPALVVCDEAHVLKNSAAQISSVLKRMKTPSRIGLTGYPLQNNLGEYFQMIDFIAPGFLGTEAEFRNRYSNPIANGGFVDSTEGDKALAKMQLYVLVIIISPLIFRMDQSILRADLPLKTEYILSARMPSLQYFVYKRAMQIAKEDASKKAPESKTIGTTRAEWEAINNSNKVLLTIEIVLEAVKAKGDKVLIFSRYKSVIAFLERVLKPLVKVMVLTGDTPCGGNHGRQKLIDEFNSEKGNYSVFIITPLSGGVGVNIVSANRVIIFDHGWNPSQVVDKKNTARTMEKADLKSYLQDPEENPPSELDQNEELADDVLNAVKKKLAYAIVNITSYENLVKEIDDEMTEQEKAGAAAALNSEVQRRTNPDGAAAFNAPIVVPDSNSSNLTGMQDTNMSVTPQQRSNNDMALVQFFTDIESDLMLELMVEDEENVIEQVARKLCSDYNKLDYLPPDDPQKQSILKELMGRVGHGPFIESPLRVDYGFNILLGDNVYFNYNAVLLDCNKITIGDNVFVGPNVSFLCAYHPLDPEMRKDYGPEASKPIVVGNDVWIGGNVTILPGVVIGEGSTVGAGSVVTKNVEPYVVVAGNPARVIRRLETIAVLGADDFVFASSIKRNLRTIKTGLAIAYDYKYNFVPGRFESVHQNAADKILETCSNNGGLYIKFAQNIATFHGILPEQWSQFKYLYDKAPSIPLNKLKSYVEKELGRPIDEVFSEISELPVASASIAQVHKAVLKKDGYVVAVKIQKPDIAKQITLDLFTFKLVVYSLEKLFSLPLYWTTDYIKKHLLQEVDFINEARNTEKCSRNILANPALSNRVYVPKVYWDYTTSKILTTEWIDGFQLGDVEKVHAAGFDGKNIVATVIDCLSDQIFHNGFIHADPHPGNVLIRANPVNSHQPQVVLIDHGLYVQSSPEFTHDYALLWQSLLLFEKDKVEQIAKSWGIRDVDLFASGTLQRPWKRARRLNLTGKVDMAEMYEFQLNAKERAQQYLSDTDRVPRELLFIGKNLNLLRSNNKLYGSPVNRINLMASAAFER